MAGSPVLSSAMRIFDSHVHFVDPTRPEGIAWPAQDSRIFGSHMPRDLLQSSGDATIVGCVAVETSRRDEDDDWLIRLARQDELIKGVVLNLRPDDPDFATRFQRYRRSEHFVGVRLRPIEKYDLASPVLHHSLGMLQSQQKTIEFGAKTRRLKHSFAQLAAQFCETTWVVDHCGHPEEGQDTRSEWRDGMSEIASSPNTFCKITGGYCDVARWEPVLAFLVGEFGPDRLLFGSNWPVHEQSLGVTRSVSQVVNYFGEHSQRILEENALRAYAL